MSADTVTDVTSILNATLAYDLKLVSFAIISLLLYDCCLNLPREIPYIWGRRPNLLGVLYVIIRYGWLAIAIVDLVVWYQTETESCNVMLHADIIMRLVAYTSGAVFLALRAYALSGGKCLLAVIIFLSNEVSISPNIYELSKLEATVFPMFVGCRAALSQDTNALALITWLRAYWHASPITLASVLMRNGILCFALPIVMASVLWGLEENDMGAIKAELLQYIGPVRDALTSIVTSRFLLDLSELATRAQAAGASSGLGAPTLTRSLTPGLFEVPSVLFEDDMDMGRSLEEHV
ncbi:hypothetical protein K466DRAFT_569221 [Polyporus arcularius HHB13444]|uniref:DUF6533 domain-containing protein n=1 Tax=Polyporus arcularius HHB13444 TaxID=1314778 RepID=A0A5C3NV22_9APHY|nr:hypothetical protein K466DRAFT_569221 [Polyporus arcularius HHB13444]